MLIGDFGLRPPLWLRYGSALVAVVGFLLLSLLLRPIILPNPFILFFAAVAVSAWYGGLGPGLLATALSVVLTDAFFIQSFSPSSLGLPDIIRLAVFALVALLMSSLAEARQQAELRIMTTLASIGDGVITTDMAARVVFMNAVAEALTGWCLAQARGQNISEIFRIEREDTRHTVENPVTRVLREGVIIGLANHTLLIARDGTERPIDDSGAPIRNVRGQVIGAVLVFRDVTPQKRAAQTIERAAERMVRLQAVTAALGATLTPQQAAGVMLTQGVEVVAADAASIALLVNDDTEFEVLDAIGFSAAAVAVWDRFPASPTYPLGEAVQRRTPIVLESLDAWARRYPESAEDARLVGYQALAALPLIVGERVIGGLSVSFRDVRTLSDDDLAFLVNLAQQCAQALERARLYVAEQHARAVAEASVRLRDQFLSVASHELKTPLTSLAGNLQLIERRAAREGFLDARNQRSFAVATSQARRLQQMIDVLLDISRIERGLLSLDRVSTDLCALARQVVAETSPMLTLHTLTCVAPDHALLVDGDALRLEQVLQNLIQNAVKYSPHGGPVLVQIFDHDAQACIAVRDVGIGIPQAAQAQLFQRFYRAENADVQHFTGFGIGLYVAREIVSLHGGTIRVESEEGQGSTFTVCLPQLAAML